MPAFEPLSLAVICLALLGGGFMKGATGAGTPVIAVPVIAAFFSVQLAVIVMVVPNLVTNLVQIRQHWPRRLAGGFAAKYALGGAAGAAVGTAMLARLPGDALVALVALAVTAYIALRLLHPEFRLSLATAGRLVWPVGLAAGVLQGAAGISAPISVSFLNAMRLDRPAFIATISVFFAAMTAVQIPALAAWGLLSWPLVALSAAALLPIFLGMHLGAAAARHLSAEAFDKAVLGLLSVLAARLIWVALT